MDDNIFMNPPSSSDNSAIAPSIPEQTSQAVPNPFYNALMRNIEDPVDKFDKDLNVFTSERELFTSGSNRSKNIYNKIGSQIDIKLNDFFNKLESDDSVTKFEKDFEKHVSFKPLNINNTCNTMITEELGISLDKFEEYVTTYKGLLNKYFQEVVEKEKKIKDSLEDLKNLRKWVDRVRNFRFSSALLMDDSIDLQRNPVEDNLLKAIEEFVKEKVDKFDAVKLREEYEMSKNCFIQLVNIGKKINNFNQTQLCVVCLTNTIDTVLLPCGHTGCSVCIDKIKNSSGSRRNVCYVCRGTISKTQKIFFST